MKTAAERKAAQRKRLKRLGLTKREFYLTDRENKLVKLFLRELRADNQG